MRCLSFVAIGALDVQSIALHDDGGGGNSGGGGSQPSMDMGPEDPDTQFYEKVGWFWGLGCRVEGSIHRTYILARTKLMKPTHPNQPTPTSQAVLVLFDLPDFVFISAYVLLALVWAEAFVQSRSHWLSVKEFRRCVVLVCWVFGWLVGW